jgi:8-oxo-dGTP pyrophosphatase MutT (NUDIX family)
LIQLPAQYSNRAFLRERLARPDQPDQAVATQDASAAAWADDTPAGATPLVPAAVLAAIVTGPEPGVLLTKRCAALRRHSGQVSFPGGRIDAGDASAEAAALREAQEEVGVTPKSVEIIGRLRDYRTGTGYRITPILALIDPETVFTPAPQEVEDVFLLDLRTLLDPAAPEQKTAEYAGKPRHYWVWPHPRHHIWGATAAILVHLANRLKE